MAESPRTVQVTRLGFPNARINVGLQIRGKRPDGFHTLESLFIPVPWQDALEIETLPEGATCGLTPHGLAIPGRPQDNLILKAYEVLAAHFQMPPVHFHLVKSIPMGAGLGGGSSDAACALKLLDAHFNLGLSSERLRAFAAQLGSDCPFFIDNVPARVTGRGEHVEAAALDLAGWWVAILHPGIHVPTVDAFGWITPNDDRPGLDQWVNSSPSDWNAALRNDFTAPVADRFPEVADALNRLHGAGATFSDMSGSGSAVFGFFSSEPDDALILDCPPSWKTWKGRLAD